MNGAKLFAPWTLSVMLCLAASGPATASEDRGAGSNSAIAFLKAHDTGVQAVLERGGDSLSAAARQEVKDKINAAFDFEELSRLALGDHWDKRSAEERTEFVATFSGIISEKNFDSFVSYYRDGDIVYDSEEIAPPRATVYATVPGERENVGIAYRLLEHEHSWRVYDLVIDDASTADGYRRQYARHLKKKSFEDLLERMRKQLEKLENR